MENKGSAIALKSNAEDNSLRQGISKFMSGRLSITNLGEIAQFQVPEGWQALPEDRGGWAQSGYSRDFCPPDSPNVVLSIYNRGSSVPQEAFRKFLELLQEPAHKLESSELDSIAQVLSKLADEEAFEITNAETLMLSGRKILSVDGIWKLSGLIFHGIFISSDDQQVQEIFFESSPEDFSKYIQEVRNSVFQISWMAA